MKQALLDYWLTGTTCCRPNLKEVIWETETHVLLRHRGHSSYCGRFSGNAWCPTYVVLVEKAVLAKPPVGHYLHTAIGKWEGRWSRARMQEAKTLANRKGELPS